MQPTLLQVAWDDPRAVRLRDSMEAEMSERYATDDAVEPEGFARKRAAALAVEPDAVIATVLVLDDDGTPVGHAALRERNGDVEIKRVITATTHRGRGVGTRLMDAMERIAREHGARRVVLQTGARQPEAIALYEKRGYTPIPVYEPYRETMPRSLCYEKLLTAAEPTPSETAAAGA